MQSYTRQTQVQTSQGPWTNYSETFIVTPEGATLGDRKAPNPIAFSRVKAMPGIYASRSTAAFNCGRLTSGFTVPYIGTDFTNVPPFCSGELDFLKTDNRALEKVYDQLRGDVNFTVDLAEGGAAARMVRGVADFRKVFRDFLKGVIVPRSGRRGLSRGQATRDYASNKWLEYQYGWMPLVSSIYAAAEELRQARESGRIYAKGRSSSETRKVASTGSGSFLDPIHRRESIMTYRTEYKLAFQMPAGVQLYNWFSLDPLVLAWELTTLSFVADWFVNVGNYLQMWENYNLFSDRFVGGYKTRTMKEVTFFSVQGSTQRPDLWSGACLVDGVNETVNAFSHQLRMSKDRTLVLNLPRPAYIQVKFDLKAAQVASAGALFHQMITKKFR